VPPDLGHHPTRLMPRCGLIHPKRAGVGCSASLPAARQSPARCKLG
jgi:hypothetical protein